MYVTIRTCGTEQNKNMKNKLEQVWIQSFKFRINGNVAIVLLDTIS